MLLAILLRAQSVERGELDGDVDDVFLADAGRMGLEACHREVQLAEAAVHRALAVRRVRAVLQLAVAQAQELVGLGVVDVVREVHEELAIDTDVLLGLLHGLRLGRHRSLLSWGAAGPR